ncbi:50S ribosomal protein L10 [[Eubacterium] cellulosolvens]
MTQSKIQPWKAEAFTKMESLITKYPVIAISNLAKMRSSQIHEMRKKLRGQAEMVVTKKNITQKVADKIEGTKPNITTFINSLDISPLFLFTEMNPFSLVLLLNKSKIRVPAKGGDIATDEIIIPAGNTGIPPGPVISEFGEVKVPTKIESGSIWVSRDTVVARKGDKISTRLASLLTRLGIKPMEAGLTLTTAYEDGTIYPPDLLDINLDKVRSDLQQAAAQAFNLAVNAVFPTTISLPPIISKAYGQALSVATEAEYLTKESASHVLRKAHAQAQALAAVTHAGKD